MACLDCGLGLATRWVRLALDVSPPSAIFFRNPEFIIRDSHARRTTRPPRSSLMFITWQARYDRPAGQRSPAGGRATENPGGTALEQWIREPATAGHARSPNSAARPRQGPNKSSVGWAWPTNSLEVGKSRIVVGSAHPTHCSVSGTNFHRVGVDCNRLSVQELRDFERFARNWPPDHLHVHADCAFWYVMLALQAKTLHTGVVIEYGPVPISQLSSRTTPPQLNRTGPGEG